MFAQRTRQDRINARFEKAVAEIKAAYWRQIASYVKIRRAAGMTIHGRPFVTGITRAHQRGVILDPQLFLEVFQGWVDKAITQFCTDSEKDRVSQEALVSFKKFADAINKRQKTNPPGGRVA